MPLRMFDGIWIPVGAEFGGESVPAPDVIMRIEAGAYVMKHGSGQSDSGAMRWLDESDPQAVDIVCMEGAGAGKTIRAIVRGRGDLMQICYYAAEGAGRPKEFGTSRGELSVMVRYRRQIS